MNTIKTMAKEKMDKSLLALQNELGKLRTGRASLAVLDNIRVSYYGNPTPLNQVATLSTPEPRLIAIQPWETHLIPEIEKSILNANIGLTPVNDGKIVRLPIPALNEERRKDLVKQAKAKGEESRVAVRQVRRECNEELKKLEKAKTLSEDDAKRALDDIQKLTDDTIQKIDQILAAKEKDILTV